MSELYQYLDQYLETLVVFKRLLQLLIESANTLDWLRSF